MTISVTIRNVPDAARDRLAERARRNGQSLQEYVRALLIDAAEQATVDEVLDRVRARAEQSGRHVPVDATLDALHADRR